MHHNMVLVNLDLIHYWIIHNALKNYTMVEVVVDLLTHQLLVMVYHLLVLDQVVVV